MAAGMVDSSLPSRSVKPGTACTSRCMNACSAAPACGSCDMVVNVAARCKDSLVAPTNDVAGSPANTGVEMARSGSDRTTCDAKVGRRPTTAFSSVVNP